MNTQELFQRVRADIKMIDQLVQDNERDLARLHQMHQPIGVLNQSQLIKPMLFTKT